MNIRPMFTADPSDRVRTASGSDRIKRCGDPYDASIVLPDPVATARGSDTMGAS